jgi:hypothetical protein
MEIEGKGPQTFTTIIVPEGGEKLDDFLEGWLRGN